MYEFILSKPFFRQLWFKSDFWWRGGLLPDFFMNLREDNGSGLLKLMVIFFIGADLSL